MKVVKTISEVREIVKDWRKQGLTVGLVPTMGYLHEGHISLITEAKRRKADEIVVSVFVNPVQFGPNEDYAKYPRDEKADLAKCKAAGATAVFFPTPENMYLDRHSVYVYEEDLSKGLCGARRPGHFRGVCTVVAKLFNLTHPDFAVFGQKDYQQAQIIRRMVRDLNFDLDTVIAPIVREASGLARSSRNTYLSSAEKGAALAISHSLKAPQSDAKKAVRAGKPLNADKMSAKVVAALQTAGLKVDYVECVDGSTLEPVKTLAANTCVLVAAYSGKTRLIDNVLI